MVAASLVGASFWIVLPAAGAIYALAATRRFAVAAAVLAVALVALVPGRSVTDFAALAAAPTALALFWAGLKGGLLTFGGAYTAIPFVRADAVGKGWMTDAQFLDGLGLSGVIPAPLVIFATFVGYVSAGLPGALAATAGMFLPAFAFSLLFYERLEALVEHRRLQLFLAGVAAGVVGVIVVTTIDLAGAALRSPLPPVSVAIFAVALAILYRWKRKLAPPAVLAMGAAAGAALL